MPGKRGRKPSRKPKTVVHQSIDTRLVRSPRVLPTISQGAISTRWVRFVFQRPTTGTWFLSVQSVYNSVFGSTDANSRYSYLYILGIRVWLESGGASPSTLVIRVPPTPFIAGSSVDTQNSASFYRSDGEAGDKYACISVHMSELWKITPQGPLDSSVVAIIDTASVSTVATTPLITNLSQVTIDARVKLHQNSLPVATYREPEPFEMLHLKDEVSVIDKQQMDKGKCT